MVGENYLLAKSAIERFVRREALLRETYNAAVSAEISKLMHPLSTKAWFLNDGVAIVRFLDWRGQSRFEWVVANSTLDDWFGKLLLVPLQQGEVSVLPGFACGHGSVVVNCRFNDVVVPYAEFLRLNYDSPVLTQPEKAAIVDFKITTLRRMLEELHLAIGPNRGDPVACLQRIVAQFESTLSDAKENEAQEFLKRYPILLGSATLVIPKQKLGEDFVTDFVVMNTEASGTYYTLVEIESPRLKLISSKGDFTAEFTHAVGQTLAWAQWLEQHKPYLQTKLKGFESPKYMIVMGRTKDLDERGRARLRSYNREQKNTRVVTYDDILQRTRELLATLELVQ